jgi:hypothetical protein
VTFCGVCFPLAELQVFDEFLYSYSWSVVEVSLSLEDRSMCGFDLFRYMSVCLLL